MRVDPMSAAQMTVSEILDKAANIIEANGLADGQWYQPTGAKSPLDCPMCTGGALAAAAGFYPMYASNNEPTGAYADAIGVLAERLGLDPSRHKTAQDVLLYGIAPWNDVDGRTAEEVVRELRAAAAEQRKAGR